MAKDEIVYVDLTKPDAATEHSKLMDLEAEWIRLGQEGRTEEAQAVLDRMHRIAAGQERDH